MSTLAISVREVIEAYEFGNRPASDFLADDSEYTIMATGEVFKGKEQILSMLKMFYGDSFSEVKTSVRNIAADEEKGLGFIEFKFRGKHTGAEFLGVKPKGNLVECPVLNVYEISDGKIKKARLYYDGDTILHQLHL